MNLDFGVFDHLDRGGFGTQELYANRLRLVEAYDRAGFYAYHLAEHHATSLGMAPSPGIFLSAVAQRTKRLRFGPMVYVLPAHQPLRLVEEICMLDNLSGGRLELGIGRGFSPFELAYFGINHLESRSVYTEAFEVIMTGLKEEVLNFRGEHFRYTDVPIILKPVQRPHPPLWYGLTRPDAAAWAAKNGINALINGPAARTRPMADRFWSDYKGPTGAIKLGLTRHVHVADTDKEAEETARRAYDVWYRSNSELYRRFNTESFIFQPSLDAALKAGTAIVGSPETACHRIEEDMRESGANYLVSRLAFGDLPLERVLRCVELIETEVMPKFRGEPARHATGGRS
jgi:alkanesulfonate monooxygenase SsuD/methylene tetrahydromethanopterin reductase-like flavin-dependent oxidoreductase (luciferase family)